MGYKRHPKKRNVDPSSREMMYNKSRESILKKAAELCNFDNTDVGLLMFSPTGELTSYANKGRVEDMFLRYIEQRDDSDGPLENEEFLCQGLKHLKFEAEMMERMDRVEALESRLNELNRLKYIAEEKMRFYKPDASKIHSEAEAHYHQQFLTNALRKIEKLKMAKLLEEEASPPNRTCDGASTSSGVGSS
ncbi:agamous-like MADS-box protein AGL66 isoform X1 [Hibiscus syriacus]|uniref:agamous-like MADS-box protein AGL66 isoform X1 n=1 Tax=Hibiscus syriacus TaxID=106335 RepID=UPI001924AF60|nr:agamous-like MADS-box protein AGL66 isoform X1 [Hibiscus syriacus]